MMQEMMGWQQHQMDHMQIICTSFWTDNYASTSSLQKKISTGQMVGSKEEFLTPNQVQLLQTPDKNQHSR